MRHSFLALLLAIAVPAQAQTVVNLSNYDPAALNAGPTVLDLSNTSSAFSSGGLFAGAISGVSQGANNQLNVVDALNLGGGSVPATPFGGMPVQINMVMGGATSLTTNNLGTAIVGGIVPAAGNAQVSGGQSGINTVNSAVVGAPSGSLVTINQTTVPIGMLPLAQAMSLRMGSVNTLLASGGSIAGSAGGSASSGPAFGGLTMWPVMTASSPVSIGSGPALTVQMLQPMQPAIPFLTLTGALVMPAAR